MAKVRMMACILLSVSCGGRAYLRFVSLVAQFHQGGGFRPRGDQNLAIKNPAIKRFAANVPAMGIPAHWIFLE
ncbi:MAG: hypothetical protein WAQ52_05470 [Terriglobales bacterium]